MLKKEVALQLHHTQIAVTPVPTHLIAECGLQHHLGRDELVEQALLAAVRNESEIT